MRDISLRLTDEQYEAMRKLAVSDGLGVSSWIRLQACNSAAARGVILTGEESDERPVTKEIKS